VQRDAVAIGLPRAGYLDVNLRVHLRYGYEVVRCKEGSLIERVALPTEQKNRFETKETKFSRPLGAGGGRGAGSPNHTDITLFSLPLGDIRLRKLNSIDLGTSDRTRTPAITR
jgi:hypothetical protein